MIRRMAAVMAAVSLVSSAVSAQTADQLREAIRLTQEGLGDSARAMVGRVLASTPRTDPLFPQVLYTVAVVAQRNDDRQLYLQRVVVEYPASQWADDAMLQLAQIEYAADNPAGTVQYITRLLADYPASPITPSAMLWGARAAYETRNALLACQWAARGLSLVGGDIELRNQLQFQQQRCQAAQAQEPSNPPAPAPSSGVSPPPPPPTAPARRGPVYRVQVAALKDQAAVDRAVANLKRLGFEAVVAREGGFLKVRAGAFATRAEAQAAIPHIREELGGQPFVVVEPAR